MKNSLETRLGIFVALAVIASLFVIETVGGLSLFKGGYRDDISRGALVSNANCFWFPGGKLAPSLNPETHLKEGNRHKISYAAWRKAGHDQLSLVADPRITEGRKTWRVAKNSPALKLGFVPHDWSKCGPRPKGRRT